MKFKNLLKDVLNEAKGRKPVFGSSDGWSYAVNIKSLDSNAFLKEPFGRRLGDVKKVNDWIQTAKQDFVGSKGKSTLASVRAWVKENKLTEFYAKWKKILQCIKMTAWKYTTNNGSN